jgi:protein TonB
MFEQTFVHVGGAVRKPWSMAASLAVQFTLTAFVVVIPLFKTAEIMWKPPRVVFVMPHVNRPMPVEASSTSAAAASPVRPVFDLRLKAPAHIPDHVAMIVDEVASPPIGSGLFAGGDSRGIPFLQDAVGRVLPEPVPVAQPIARTPRPEAVRVGGSVQQAMLLRQPMPIYPPLARAARVSGKVVLAAVIAPNGTVQKLQLQSGPPLLVEAALKAVRQWIYKPTMLNGEPVEVITEITVNFTLSQ